MLSDDSEDVQLAVANAGGIEAMLQLCKEGSPEAQKHATGALVNLASSETNGNKDTMMTSTAVNDLLALVNKSTSAEAQCNSVQTLRHLISKNRENQDVVVKAGGFKSFVRLLSTSSMETREQAAGILLDFVWSSSSNKQMM